MSEKVLIYTGPVLSKEEILERIPGAIIRGPLQQAQLLSELIEFEPAYVLILEGTFHQNLSIWHKEIVYALQVPGVKAVYGAASMGALRAADLADYGMIGCGKIFQWYYEGVLTDESEVAALYSQAKDGNWLATTVPLVNVRGALLKGLELGFESEGLEEIFNRARAIHWTERTPKALLEISPVVIELLAKHNQKAIDALQLLCTYQELKPAEDAKKLDESALSQCFAAQYERDRWVTVGKRHLRLQDLDAYVTLHDPDYDKMLERADTRELALMLADIYRVGWTNEELDSEWTRLNIRLGLRSQEEHDAWLRANHLNGRDLVQLLVDQVRLRKLRKALMVRNGPRRRTKRLLDYLKLAGVYEYWAAEAAQHEGRIERQGSEEALYFGGQTDVALLLAQHATRTGLTIASPLEDYVREAGFGSVKELMVALARNNLGNANLPRE